MNDFFIERDIKSNLNKLRDVFDIISLNGKYKIIGSSNLKNIKYNSDFDLQEFYENKKGNIKSIVKYFQSIYKKLDAPDSYSYITDFKAGLDSNDEPLKWTKQEIIKNKKKLKNNKYIDLETAIQQKATIKIDVITFINNTFIEISENYYIRIGNKSNFEFDKETNKDTIIQSIKQSQLEEVKDDNYNKALKRMFSGLMISNKKSHKLKILVDFFNSSSGILNKARSDLDVLILLLEKNIDVKFEHFMQALDNIKYNISYNTIKEYVDKFIALEKITDKRKLYIQLVKLRNDIFDVVNKESKILYNKIK